MKAVKVGNLKANLSAHLRYVRGGEEIIVCDRDRPIARIVPIRDEEQSDQLKRLVARGVLTPPTEPKPRHWPKLTGKPIPDEVMEQVWREERDGR